MRDREKILKTIEELRKMTGLPLTLGECAEGSEEETADKLTQLAGAWKTTHDREAFLRRLLSGSVEEEELFALAQRFHLKDDCARDLYVISAQEALSAEAERVLKNLFVTKGSDLFVRMSEVTAVLILEKKSGDRAILAHTIVDMLGAEIMLYVKIGYAASAETLAALPAAYRDARTALRIGEIFYTNEQVFSYEKLGIGKLIYDLPKESCRKYLAETLGDVNPADFDEETVALIDAFFDNNLSIAEAARQLYLHRNTMSYRIDKLRQLTGLDLRVFDDAVSLKIAMMIAGRLRSTGEMK